MKKITIRLGPAEGVLERRVRIRRVPGAGDDVMPSPVFDSDVGPTESLQVGLSEAMYQLEVTDYLASGEKSEPQVVGFHTGSSSFPGSFGGLIGILGIEDLSSSSDSDSYSDSVSSSLNSSSLNSSSSASSSVNSSSSSANSTSSSANSSSHNSSSSSSLNSSSSASNSESSQSGLSTGLPV